MTVAFSKTCEICEIVWETRWGKSRTCSSKCAAALRQKEGTNGAGVRVYAPELVEYVRQRYESGATMQEIQAELKGTSVQTLMTRCGIKRRSGGRIDQTGRNNPSWRGDDAKYVALHIRVHKARGKPEYCTQCDVTGPGSKYEWANMTGDYSNTDDYQRMCIPCHRKFDALRRRKLGTRITPIDLLRH